jgi:hypothetical protein
MSLHSFLYSQTLSKHDPPFYALLFSMIRKADTDNTEIIKRCWPAQYAEFVLRYHAPGGILPEDNIPPGGEALPEVPL